jgi:hypothetical protein
MMASVRVGVGVIALLAVSARTAAAQGTEGAHIDPSHVLETFADDEHDQRVFDAAALGATALIAGSAGAGLLTSASLSGTPTDIASSHRVDGYTLIGIGGLAAVTSTLLFLGSGPLEQLRARGGQLSSQELVDRWQRIATRARTSRLLLGWTLIGAGALVGAFAAVNAFLPDRRPRPSIDVFAAAIAIGAMLDGMRHVGTRSAAELGWQALGLQESTVGLGIEPVHGGAALTFRLTR